MGIQDKISLWGNPQKRTILIDTDNINNATITNQAKQNMEKLCKGKIRYQQTLDLPTDDETSVLCFE